MASVKKAILIGIDGCRPDALLAAKAPRLHTLIAEGAFSELAQTGVFTDSAPCWSDMLTGVWQTKHGVRDNSFEGARYEAYPHFFARAKALQPALCTASIVHWEPINGNILSAADYQQAYDTDAEVAEAVADHLLNADSDLLFLQLDEVDAAGHKYGYAVDSPGYLEAIQKADSQIDAMLTALQSRTSYAEEDWLIAVSTDHGGSEFGHGKNIPEHRTIFVLLHGGETAQHEIAPPPQVVDIVPTILAHFGMEPLPSWEWEGTPIPYS